MCADNRAVSAPPVAVISPDPHFKVGFLDTVCLWLQNSIILRLGPQYPKLESGGELGGGGRKNENEHPIVASAAKASGPLQGMPSCCWLY